ncbi:MAG: IS630 family transposase [Adhaeribacter sp.]
MRKRVKGKPDAALYQVRSEALGLLEEQSRQGHVDLFYADESQVSPEGYVPSGWQFAAEDVSIESAKGKSLNCFALISRDNRLRYATREQSITADFIVEALDRLSLELEKPTVVVLDNARVHTADKVKKQLQIWQQRGLFLFYLPVYSPHLNIAERLWKELKARWLKPQDYRTTDTLFYKAAGLPDH